jgi:hypothetical protein
MEPVVEDIIPPCRKRHSGNSRCNGLATGIRKGHVVTIREVQKIMDKWIEADSTVPFPCLADHEEGMTLHMLTDRYQSMARMSQRARYYIEWNFDRPFIQHYYGAREDESDIKEDLRELSFAALASCKWTRYAYEEDDDIVIISDQKLAFALALALLCIKLFGLSSFQHMVKHYKNKLVPKAPVYPMSSMHDLMWGSLEASCALERDFREEFLHMPGWFSVFIPSIDGFTAEELVEQWRTQDSREEGAFQRVRRAMSAKIDALKTELQALHARADIRENRPRPVDITCGICLEINTELEMQRLSRCNHLFHAECLLTWLTSRRSNQRTCPTCRDTVDV